MFCKNCGANLDDDAVFCDKCGTEIKRDISTDKVETVNILDPETESTTTIESKAEPAISTSSEEETVSEIVEEDASPVAGSSKKRPVTLIAAIAAVVVVAALAVLFLLFGGSNKEASDARADSNFNNGAKFAYDNKSLYFIGLFDDDDNDTCVYSTSYTGTNKTLISNDPDICKIRITNGKILYEVFGEDTYTIGIMEKNGSNRTTIIEMANGSDDYLVDFNATSSRLYYIYNNELRSCTLDGKDDCLLVNGAKSFVLVGKTIYYATEKSIFSYNIKKAESTEICNSEASNLVFDEGKLYFRNSDGIYRVATTGKEGAQRVVKDSSVGNYVLDGDTIYYVQKLEMDAIAEIANILDEDNAYKYALALIGSGQIERVPKLGGNSETVETNQLLSFSLYVYPDGMYSKLSALVDTMSLVEFE